MKSDSFENKQRPPRPLGQFPDVRMRRLRQSPVLRDLVRETSLAPANLIMPLFVRHGRGVKSEISSMPGQYQFSTDTLIEAVDEAYTGGLRSFILVGVPDRR